MPAFYIQNGPRLQIPLKSQAKRTALGGNVFESYGGEKRARPNGTVSSGQLQERDENGHDAVGPMSMQERLRLASASSDAGPSNSTRLDHGTNGDGLGPRLDVNGGAEAGGAGAAGLGVLPLDCQPVEVSMYADVSEPGVGLVNLGNTCYLNSVLQCLLHTRPLHNLLMERHHSKYCGYGPNRAEGFCPLCLLERRLRTSFYNEPRNPRPVAIAKNLHHFAPQLRIGEQEDAHELLRLMIDSCHRTCLLQQRGYSPDWLTTFEDRSKREPTAIRSMFGGIVQNQVKCLTCGFESNKRDVFMDLSLDLAPSTHSVYAALQAFIMPERLDGANKYRCERCKKLSAARKQMQILRAPNVLVIQLKRFENICGGKITRHVHFSETLSLAGVMAPGSRDPPPEYSLYALIVHEGSTQQLGHYYACAKVSRYWYCFNDSSVRPVHWADVSRQGAYILFYLRTRPPGSVFFYPPKSQGSGKESAGGAARVYGPQPPAGPVKSAASVDTVRMEAGSASTGPLIGRQLPPGHRGPVEASGSAKSVRSEAGNGPAVEPTGPLYGPQLPPGYRGSVEAPVSSEPTGGELGNGAEPAGPLYGPQLPLGYWGPVNAQASAEAGRLEAGNGAAAPPAGPLYGPQLPPSYSGPVGSGKGAGMVQTEVGSSTAMPPAGPPNGPRLPSVSVGPVEAISAPGIAGSESREEKCALPARPLGGIPLSLGPVSAVGGSSQSNFESSGQMKGLPARPVPQLPTPPETPPLPQGLVSQAVTAEGNPSGRCERGRIGPELSPGGAVRGPERETLVSSLDGEPLIDPRVSQEGADCPMGVTANGRTGPASGGEPNRGDVSIAVEDNVSMSRGETVAAGARERHDLKRRLSGADAPVALEPERKLSKSEGTLDFEVDGKQKTGVTNGGGSRREAAGGGNTRDAARRGGPVANAWHGASTAELVMPGVADVGNKKGQDGLHPRPDGVYRDSQIGNALGQNGKADRTGVKTTDGNEGVGRAAATASGPQHEELLDGRGGTSTRPQAAVVEARGPAACQLDAGGKVEIIDASAWSLAFSYGSDDDEECEEALKPDAIISPSASACPVEGNLFDQGSNTMQKPLPGLVEAETLLQGGAGMGIFGWSKS